MIATDVYRQPQVRAGGPELHQALDRIDGNPVLTGLFAGVDGLLAVLNRSRQVLLLNDTLMRRFGIDDPAGALGLRPGEVVKCVHIGEGRDGCGTGRACSSCGAAIALALCEHSGRVVERTCALRRQDEGRTEDLVLRVRVSPLEIEGQQVLLLLLQDRTREHQAEAVERSLFHNLNNHLGILTATCELLAARLSGRERELAASGLLAAGRMAAEIVLHQARGTSAATDALRVSPVAVADLLAEVQAMVSAHPAAAERIITIAFDPHADGCIQVAGRVLLGRILVNMGINACEATAPGATVRIGAARHGGWIELSVWNREAIPAAVKPRIFQRHFSTKVGSGRGQGTWAIKDLGERLLGGEVSFTSSEADGTVFLVRVPPV
jgi:signal transduction histidine kinase